MSDAQNQLDRRYGRSRKEKMAGRLAGAFAGAVFAVILGAWLWWGGVLETPAQLQYRDISHEIPSSREVIVNYEVTAVPGTNISCAIQALNESFGIVGWKIEELGPAESWTRVYSTTLRTSEPAVTGLIYECWLP